MYADDTSFMLSAVDYKELEQNINEDLLKIEDWARRNGLQINASKIEFSK